MTQFELERQVASSTGESRRTIRNRGFSLVVIPCRPPLTVDWDKLNANRTSFLPDRQPCSEQVG